ncbi:MAG: SDR family oxidoreductase [Rhodospirillaceae bacterium]
MTAPNEGAFLITGASRGIGFATATRLADAGKTVIGLARSAPEGGFPGHFVSVDLGNRKATADALKKIAGDHDVTGLVNNVGINITQLIEDVDLASFDRVIDLNVRTAIQCVQAFLPSMRARHYGRIVNISSRGALGRPKRTSYGAAKYALESLVRTWAIELATDGITVNGVAPGPVATEMFIKNNLEGRPPEVTENFLAEIPMGRFGEPDEIAAAIEFFLKPDAGYITGQTLLVCGGSSLGAPAG